MLASIKNPGEAGQGPSIQLEIDESAKLILFGLLLH